MVGDELANIVVFASISATKVFALEFIAALVDTANSDKLLVGTASWCDALSEITSTVVAWAACGMAFNGDHLLVGWTLWLLGNALG